MKLRNKLIFSVVFGGLAFNACSTKKDALLNRNWHALNTKYNTLYNGNIAFEEGREGLNAVYQDNYWEILPVERLEVTEDIKLDSEDNNPNFLIAEEKATKAIQKHSMDIKDEERNPQTDEAFLLLGKARYFDQRYMPALESFNYILNKYTQSDKLNEATIWREKVNIRLENEELALRNLKRLIKQEYLSDQEYADARAMMGQAYINLKIQDTAIQQLKIASVYTKKNPERGRYLYIIGQLFNELGYKDSANYAFDKVIDLNRKSPRVYMINAHLQKIQNTELTDDNREEMYEYLTELEEDRENRPFLNKIYRQVAEFHLATKSDSLALVYYNKSLRATQNMPQLNALNYENLAIYNFDQNEYKPSGAYYDSVLQNLNENTKKYREVKKKLDNLEDVIKYEEVVQYTDSVITLYEFSIDDRITYFEEHIAQLKAVAENKRKKGENMANAGFAAFSKTKGGKENQGKFYFYNITTLGYGKNDFKTRWGKRTLEDDWRWSNKSKAQNLEVNGENPANTAANNVAALGEEEKYSVEFYLSQIPTDPLLIDSLRTERNFANYQLGLIYKEKFKENLLAAGKLESVLKSNPEERLIIPSKYNLYKIYEESGSSLATDMKYDIIKNHPESRYAEILLNPQAILTGSADSPDAKYQRLYKMFQNQEFLQVITGAEENISKYTGDPIVPKFEMLKANAIGRLQGFEDFKEALNYVALNYPNNPEGKKAQTMVAEQLPKLEPKVFSTETESTGTGNWKVVFPLKIRDDKKALRLKELLEKSIEDLKYKNVVSKDIYNLEDQFVVVHGFKSKDFALGYAELIKNNKDYRIDDENFVILSNNYKIIQVHKNIADYKAQQ
ncbi:protein involved in gliding motility SprE [Arenibacter algicola]|uniref:Protein involved in gliding motility SprE n=1 Tax=Arenibacter algicola TaxID=616991 RepID=A0ABY3AG77_9FLAO